MIDTLTAQLAELGVEIEVTYCPVVFGSDHPWQIDAAFPDEESECGHRHMVKETVSFDSVIEELNLLLVITKRATTRLSSPINLPFRA